MSASLQIPNQHGDLVNVYEVQAGGVKAFVFEAGLAIDVDGAPNAYGPNDTGLDYTQNAKDNGAWVGVYVDPNTGQPVIQASGPFQGYYVSTTSLSDSAFAESDPRRYVDATNIPYIVLPLSRLLGVSLGALAFVSNALTEKSTAAIFADTNPGVGEASVFAAQRLGIANVSPRTGGVASRIRYAVFPGSGTGRPLPLNVIDNNVAERVAKFGSNASDLWGPLDG
jgi:hypothetical protein